MDINKLLALLPTATLPTETVLKMLNLIGQLSNSSQTYSLWSEVTRLLVEQAQAKESEGNQSALRSVPS